MAAPQKRNKTVDKRGDKKEKSQRIMEQVGVGVVGVLEQIHRSSIGLLPHANRHSMHQASSARQTSCRCLAVLA
jgi:hypothetical protein